MSVTPTGTPRSVETHRPEPADVLAGIIAVVGAAGHVALALAAATFLVSVLVPPV